MEALYWIVGIAASIVLAHFLAKKLGYAVARRVGSSVFLFWLVWTLGGSTLVVGYALTGPLAVFQSVVIIGAFLYSRQSLRQWQFEKEGKRRAEAQKLAAVQNWRFAEEDRNKAILHRERLEKKISTLKRQHELSQKLDVAQVLSTQRQHRAKLLECLENAQQRLIILSGWATDYVVDNSFGRLLNERLENGVDVYIGYGWQSKYEKRQSNKNQEVATQALTELSNWALRNRTPGRLHIRLFPNHAKLLIRDEHSAVFGSFNWLSNSGRSNNDDVSIVVKDVSVIRKETQRIIAKWNILDEEAGSSSVA